MVRLGQTFVNREAPGIPSHLWMILSNPGQEERVVIANLTTMRDSNPEACVVRPGDHKYVSRESVVAMKAVRVTLISALDAAQANGLLSASVDLSPALLARVQKAVGASSLVVNEAKEMLRRQSFI